MSTLLATLRGSLIGLTLFVLLVQTVGAQTAVTAPERAPAPDKTALARSEALRVVDAWLDGIQAYRHIPAISAGVVVGDNLVWSKGYGTLDADHKNPCRLGHHLLYLLYLEALYFDLPNAAIRSWQGTSRRSHHHLPSLGQTQRQWRR